MQPNFVSQSKNVLCTKQEIEHILNSLGPIGDNNQFLNINDLDIYQHAFVHESYFLSPHKTIFVPTESNERLEFLGDRFIGAIVSRYLTTRFPKQQEGFLTTILSRIVRSSMLAHFTRQLGLGKFILLCPEFESNTLAFTNKGRNSQSIYEDTFESFCGAVIQDFGDEHGYRYLKRFIVKLIESEIDFASIIAINENHKDTLQHYFQKMKWPNPVYIDMYESGPKRNKIYTKGVFVTHDQFQQLTKPIQERIKAFSQVLDSHPIQVKKLAQEKGHIVGISKAIRKLDAEQDAAQQAINNLGIGQVA